MLPKRIYNYRHRKNSITVAPLGEKTFHFEQHTAVMCPYIEERYPALRDRAEYLRAWSLRYSVLTGELSDKESRKKFSKELKNSRKELRKHTAFLLKSPLIPKTERMQDLTLAWGIYGPIHRLRHPQG